ncbi:hypothetical protein MKX03_019381, partial [Papaver bracteatum]
MGCFNLVSIFFIFLFFFSSLLITVRYTTAQQYFNHLCLGANYTTGSTFQANLNRLFPSNIQNRYYNATVGQSPDTVYGSLQCRGDIPQDECQGCVDFAIQNFNKTDRCPNSKQAIIWYDTCMLRYSDQDYFTIMLELPRYYLVNSVNVSNPSQFNPILNDFLTGLVGEAGSSGFYTNFATGDKNITNRKKLYGLVHRCLFGAMDVLPGCCDGKQGARVIGPSCMLRYELYYFYESTITSSTPPLSSPTPLELPPSSRNTNVPNG